MNLSLYYSKTINKIIEIYKDKYKYIIPQKYKDKLDWKILLKNIKMN